MFEAVAGGWVDVQLVQVGQGSPEDFLALVACAEVAAGEVGAEADGGLLSGPSICELDDVVWVAVDADT